MSLILPPRKSLLKPKSSSLLHVAAFYAAGTGANNIAAMGALAGDLLVISAPYDNCLAALGMATGSNPNWGHGYTNYWGWKLLADNSPVALGANSYGAAFGIWRGPNKATFRAIGTNAAQSNTTTADVIMPAALGDTIGYAAFGHDRSGDVANAVAPAGWSAKRLSAFSGVFTYEVWDCPGAQGARTDTFTNFSPTNAYIQMVSEFELGYA